MAKKIFFFIFILLIFFFFGGFLFGFKKLSQKNTQVPPSLFLNPEKGNFKSGQVFELSILLDTQGYKSSGVGARLNFQPESLEVLEITESNIFGLYPSKKFNNQNGEIKISGLAWNPSLGKPDKPFSGKAVLAKIKFRVKPLKKRQKTLVNFYFLNLGNTTDSNIMDAETAKDVLGQVKNGQFTLIP